MWESFEWTNIHIIGIPKEKTKTEKYLKNKAKVWKFNKNYKGKNLISLMSHKYKKQRKAQKGTSGPNLSKHNNDNEIFKVARLKKNYGTESNKDNDDSRFLIKNNASKRQR